MKLSPRRVAPPLAAGAAVVAVLLWRRIGSPDILRELEGSRRLRIQVARDRGLASMILPTADIRAQNLIAALQEMRPTRSDLDPSGRPDLLVDYDAGRLSLYFDGNLATVQPPNGGEVRARLAVGEAIEPITRALRAIRPDLEAPAPTAAPSAPTAPKASKRSP